MGNLDEASYLIAVRMLCWSLGFVAAVVLTACAHARARPFDPDTVTRRYVAVRGDDVIGTQEIVDVDPKTMRVRWSIELDRRRTELDAGYALGANEHPVWVETTGHDAWGRPIVERFLQTRREANWSNRGEKGRRRTRGGAFYFSFDRVPEEYALLTRALLAAKNRRLPLTPTGHASLVSLESRTLSGSSGSVNVRAYGIEGLDHVPVEIWLDARGRMVALARAEYTVIWDRWREHAAPLEAARAARDRRRHVAWTRELRHRSPTTLAIVGADVFDPNTHDVLVDQTVLVTDDRISAVGPTAAVAVPADARRLEARRALLVPGLWDLSGSSESFDGLLHVAAGITSIRPRPSVAQTPPAWLSASGDVIGPRIHAPARYDSMRRASCRTQPTEARPKFDNVVHTAIAVNWSDDAGPDDDPLCLTAWDLALSHAIADDDWPALVDLAVPVEIELATIEHLLTAKSRAPSPGLGRRIDEWPLVARRRLTGGGFAATSDDPTATRRHYEAHFDDLVSQLDDWADDGMLLLPVGGEWPGTGLHRSLELLVASGWTPAQALASVTLGAAEIAGHGHELGTISPGKLADFVLVGGDPLTEIGDIERVRVVVLGGDIVDVGELRAAALRAEPTR